MISSIKPSLTPWRQIRYSCLGFFVLLWIGTGTHALGHMDTEGNGFSIGGGYIEYGYGWGWFRQKMVCHSGMPPMGWFVHRICSGSRRSYATYCMGLWTPVVILLVHELLKRAEAKGDFFKRNPSLRGLLTMALLLLVISASLKDSCMSEAAILLCPLVIIPLLIPALVVFIRRRPKPGSCKACGYNLFGNISGICPECGSPISSSILLPILTTAPDQNQEIEG